MGARTYSTDAYLACPCLECANHEVSITLSEVRNLSRLPSPACDQIARELVSKGGVPKIN